jgi:hypothetical protein
MRVYDRIWLYDENDKEYQAQVREINHKAPAGAKSRVATRIYAHIVKPTFRHNSEIEIKNDVVIYPGWTWSEFQVPPIRKNAIVVLRMYGHHVEISARVLGLTKGLGGCHPDSFVYEGIKVLKNLEPSTGKAGSWKGHRFTASTDEVIKIIDEGEGPRLLNRDFLSIEEERELFAKQFGEDND